MVALCQLTLAGRSVYYVHARKSAKFFVGISLILMTTPNV